MEQTSSVAWSSETACAYQTLCLLCSWALLNDPEKDRLAQLSTDRALLAEPPFTQVVPKAATELADALVPFSDESVLDEALLALHRDRTYLFYMVGASRTSPYESVYRSDDATMFGPTTLEVRETYLSHGLYFDRADSEPDDHIGLEFSFMAHLLGQASDELETKADTGTYPVVLDELANFLSEHVLVFAPIYLENMRLRAKTDYYRAIAGIAQGTCEALAAALGAQAVEEIDPGRFR